MNWAYIIPAFSGVVGLMVLVYHLTARRSDATIKFLEKQLDEAKAKTPDAIGKALSERILIQEAELKRSSTDRQASKEIIEEKRIELMKTKSLLVQLKTSVADFEKKHEALKNKVDTCPHCEAGLVELKDVYDEDWAGSHRKYDCGFTMLDGDTILMCPHDPMYPKFEQLELNTEYDEERKKWTCRYSDGTMKSWRLPMTVTHGKTEREATYLMQICHEGRLDNEAPTDSPF